MKTPQDELRSKTVLGLIPARAGSRGLPGKNIARVAGRPLLAYTCEAARESRYIDRVILSTDDEDIAEVGRVNGVEVPFLRPIELAQDDSPSMPVVTHAINWLEKQERWKCDIIVLLQPTSPLRTAQHIDEALETMITADSDAVVSVVQIAHNVHPYSLMRLDGNRLTDFWDAPLRESRFRRQNLPSLFARNGPAVLAMTAATVRRSGNPYAGETAPYVMKEEDSVDIDTELDLRIADCLLHARARQDDSS